MSNNKQSSIELFAIAIYEKFKMEGNGKELNDLLEQAKAMHKEEHGQTWDKSLVNLKARGMNEMRAYTDFDDYYNKTFEQ